MKSNTTNVAERLVERSAYHDSTTDSSGFLPRRQHTCLVPLWCADECAGWWLAALDADAMRRLSKAVAESMEQEDN